jgi:5,10-methylenetetrahydromethanopterin reductase
MVEIWTNTAGMPRAVAEHARQAEAAGFDGITVVDSQNLSGDTYVNLTAMAMATETLHIGSGVTNPGTRHAAVTAGAIATIQALSGGRAHLGIGRGDSALAHLGRAPVRLDAFEDYLRRLQGYLHGDEVEFEAGGDVDRLGLANRPASSRIQWLRPGRYPKVPVEVTATGPKVLAMAALHADEVVLAVGAIPDRLRWAIAVAREAKERARGDPASLRFGAYLNVVVHGDRQQAYHLGEGGISLFTRFSAMHGTVAGPMTEEDRRVLSAVHDAYDMNEHSRSGSAQAATIPPDFASRFAILGAASECIDRLSEIVAMGIVRLVIVRPAAGADAGLVREAEQAFVEDVMPALRKPG